MRARATRIAVAYGLAATLSCLAAWALGGFAWVEGALLDARAVYATRTAPKISDQIVHLDIDQESIDEVGRWPWDREKLALVIDALHEAGAKTIVLDMLLDDPQTPRPRVIRPGVYEIVDDDALLAAAFARAGNVVQGVNIVPPKRDGDIGADEFVVSRPVPGFENAATEIGFVNTGFSKRESAIRNVPAIRAIEAELLLQLGVAAAAHALGVPVSDVRVEDDTLILGDKRLPVRNGQILVPWHVRRIERDGPDTWARGAKTKWVTIHPHYPIYPLLAYERDLQNVVGILNGRPPVGPPTDAEITDAQSNAEFNAEPYEGKPLEEIAKGLDARFRAESDPKVKADIATEERLVKAMVNLSEVIGIRNEGRPIGGKQGESYPLGVFKDKIVFVGWNASGALADFYPTALDIRTPGVVVHSAIADGILTGHWKVLAPWWADAMAIVVLGILATVIASALPIGAGAPCAIGLAAVYALINAFLVFDRMGVALNAAGPIIAIGASWATCTAVRAIQEAKEKGAIRRQFRSRVSSQLVDYLAENPGLMNMEGEEREVTTMFTDFVGFTSISESLQGTATVKLLNVYLGEIAEALMKEGAYVNKFLGDGIMAFWGAPVEQKDHAARACRAAIAAVATLERVNNLPEYKDLPKLGMRLGISTGKAIVGDCGAPPKLNDYTVIGDPINLAARLESANKLVGTKILVTARTREMIPPAERDALAWRPLGLLRVVGQQKPQEIWELLGPRSMLDADPDMRAWVEKTTKAVELFRAGDYKASMELWQDLVLFERGQAGAMLYIERCAELIESGEKNPALPLRSK